MENLIIKGNEIKELNYSTKLRTINMINSSCKKQGGGVFMDNNYKKKNIINYLKGFAIGYFLVDIVCWFFKALAGKK